MPTVELVTAMIANPMPIRAADSIRAPTISLADRTATPRRPRQAPAQAIGAAFWPATTRNSTRLRKARAAKITATMAEATRCSLA